METGPGPGARDGEARVQLLIGSMDAQRSSSTCAVASRRGRCEAQTLGVQAGASGDRAGTGTSWRLPAPPGEESGEAEPPVQLRVEPATQAPATPPPLLPVLRGRGRATGTDVPESVHREAEPGRGREGEAAGGEA